MLFINNLQKIWWKGRVITLDSCERQGRVRPCRSRSRLKIGIGLKAVGDDDDGDWDDDHDAHAGDGDVVSLRWLWYRNPWQM